MIRLSFTRGAVAALALLAGCGAGDSVTPAPTLSIGEAVTHAGSNTVSLDGGSSGADYMAVLVNTGTAAGVNETFTLQGTGLTAPSASQSFASGPTLDRSLAGDGAAPLLDRSFEARLRARERAQLTPRFAVARAWMAQRSAARQATGGAAIGGVGDLARSSSAIPANAAVGDIVTVNVNGTDACTNPVYHGARVAAIGTHAIILADTLNPAGGFTTADYQRYAARFDTLVFPLDSSAFGAPTDLDGNGHIGLIFTSAVNQLTPRNANSFVGGFTFSRDLFPVLGTARADACPTSNEGEYFYLMAADPNGAVNGNVRTVGFVDSNTTAIIAHEFQHLINSGWRIYVNNATSFEETWLDEGLAHIAEELLFYKEGAVSPLMNLDATQIRASELRRSAFNLDMLGNAGRYRSYLGAPSKSSPYADDDSLPTRGAAWSLLRYLADRSAGGGGTFFFRLVNSTTTGLANLGTVYGGDLAGALRDWNVSHAVDDVAGTAAELQQPSWNWHTIYPALSTPYPLLVTTLADGTAATGTVTAGGAAYYRLSVPAGGTANVSLADQSATAASTLQFVVVRIR